MTSKKVTLKLLKQYLDYDSDAGIFTWKAIPPRSTRAIVGEKAGSSFDGEYVVIGLLGRRYLAHRLAWFYMHGRWPQVIDHINGDKHDYRMSNLRQCTRAQNCANSKKRKNMSGIKGLYWNEYNHRWDAFIIKEGKRYRKISKDRQVCVDWLEVTRKKLHGEFARAE